MSPQQEADRILAAWDRRSVFYVRQGIAKAHAHTSAERALTAGPWHGQRAAEVCPDCFGTGEVTRVDGAPTVCGECDGRGYVEGER